MARGERQGHFGHLETEKEPSIYKGFRSCLIFLKTDSE
jgi:hypothetical protein